MEIIIVTIMVATRTIIIIIIALFHLKGDVQMLASGKYQTSLY